MDTDGSGGNYYGSSGATGQFDPAVYIKKPQVILRLLGWVFAIVVFGCISSQGWYTPHDDNKNYCAYNNDAGACGYGTAIGVIAFLGLMVFLVLDGLFDNMSNLDNRKYIVIADISFSGVWSFMWFVGFCYLTNAWRNTTSDHVKQNDISKSGVEAAIAFSFFSIVIFIALTVYAMLKYRRGISDDFMPTTDPNAFGEGQQDTGTYQNQARSDYYPSPFVGGQDTKPIPGSNDQQTY